MAETIRNLTESQKKELVELLVKGGLSDESKGDVEPVWFDGKRISEVDFCEDFRKRHPLKCFHGRFYDVDGVVEEERLKAEILEITKPYLVTGVARTLDRLIDALKSMTYTAALPLQTDRIHVANGTLLLDGHFSEEKEFCVNRLPVRYRPDAPEPVVWKNFLNDLLYEEDQKAFQEFLGYVLLPTNKAQAMMLLIGNGGEGKSRIGIVLHAILGRNMNFGSVAKLASDRFYRADQEGILLLLDDDMKTDALPDTGILKSIITSEAMFDLERKGRQSVQGRLNVRIIALSNGSLSALYDKSDAFYRRQLIIRVREKPKNRKDDRALAEKMIAEKEGIFLWCLEGLRRLISQNFCFSVSDRMKANLEEARRFDDNILDFYESSGYIRFEENTTATTKKLYGAYARWCDDNLEKPVSFNTFKLRLGRDAERLKIRHTKSIPGDGGKKIRGYIGVHVEGNTDDLRLWN